MKQYDFIHIRLITRGAPRSYLSSAPSMGMETVDRSSLGLEQYDGKAEAPVLQ